MPDAGSSFLAVFGLVAYVCGVWFAFLLQACVALGLATQIGALSLRLFQRT